MQGSKFFLNFQSLATSGTTNFSKVLEQVDVEDEPGDSEDPLDTGIKLIRLL